jgi:hypothetical protein
MTQISQIFTDLFKFLCETLCETLWNFVLPFFRTLMTQIS